MSNSTIPQIGEKRTDTWSELLGRVGKTQDQQAFKQLFDHFSPLIKGFCLNNTNQSFGTDAAEEIVQEVMLKIWQKAPSYDPNKAAASTWIYTVMRNARIDLIRRNKRHPTDSDPVDVDDLWDEDGDTGPVIQFQRARDQQIIGESFRFLPPEQRQALTEVYMKGKSHSEVANESGLPLGTVKSRVRMGLQKIQAHLTTKSVKVLA
jgi:RNA polymerase sigma-70 factor (ECF subfamily)